MKRTPRKKEWIGIVGSEGKKFTADTERKARDLIRSLIKGAAMVVSGGCHLGGVDIWAVEEAASMGIPFEEHLPRFLGWTAYRERNILIAERSTRVVCITVKHLPGDYDGMRFKYCYHCQTDGHVKSGGCWTMKYARGLGKPGETMVVE